MNAGATLNAISTPIAEPGSTPVVFIDGVPEPRFVVENWQSHGALDQRSAIVRINSTEKFPVTTLRNPNAKIVLALALPLSDASVRWPVLINGRFAQATEHLDGLPADRWKIIDEWSEVLSGSMTNFWWELSDGSLRMDNTAASMLIGDRANRSEHLHEINGKSLHILQSQGQPWRLGDALASIWAWANLGPVDFFVPEATANLPLHQSIDLTQRVEKILEQLFASMDVHLSRSITRQGNTIVERAVIQSNHTGRVVRLPRDKKSGQTLGILSCQSQTLEHGAKKWVAQCKGWEIESSFILSRGWDATREVGDDVLFNPTTNANFTPYADVFRLWVLNEDGHFSGEPFHAPLFDCSVFFSENVRSEPLTFLPCITMDQTGRRLNPIVEMSLDSGATWSNYPGQYTLRTDRAAIYLGESQLPNDFLTAAQFGHARIRITASLQNPMPVSVVRWRGNPFAGLVKSRQLDAGSTFRFRRIAATSKHFSAVADGTFSSAQMDETSALSRWLEIQSSRFEPVKQGDLSTATLVLAGISSSLQPGDRLRGLSATTHPVSSKEARVRSVECRWLDGSDNARQGHNTRVELQW